MCPLCYVVKITILKKTIIMQLTKQILDELTYEIIGAAIEVHRHIGPGLLENIYQKCLAHEFTLRGIKYQTEHPVEVIYKGEKMLTDLKCDFLVENLIVLELKSVREMLPIFDAQILTYMNLLFQSKGVLVNFNVFKSMFGI